MISYAQWFAPAATMLAAVMTAANLGARITGWGFVVFTLGSIGWILVGLEGHETGLVITNGFLTLANAVGIWRWLGRQARYESVGDAAEVAGHSPAAASVVPASGLVGRPVSDGGGATVGEAVEAIIDCRSGAIHHLVIRFGGVGGLGEQIVALAHDDFCLGEKTISTRLSSQAVMRLPRLDADEWPRLLADGAAPAN